MRFLSILVNDDSFHYAVIDYIDDIYTLMDIDYANFNFLIKSEESQSIPKTRSGMPITAYALEWNVEKIAISFADSFADSAYIPDINNDSSEQTNELIKLYINQVYNSDDLSDYEIEFAKYKLAPEKNLFLMSFIPSDLFYNILKTFDLKNFPIIKSGTNFFNSIRTLEFNYPNQIDKSSLLISIHNNSIITAVIKNKVISGFSIKSLDADWANEINQLTENINLIDNVFLFGNNLNKSKFEFIKNIYPAQPVYRLGAFDRFTHSLDKRHLDFAGSMFHNYTGVIGVILTNPQSTINQFKNEINSREI